MLGLVPGRLTDNYEPAGTIVDALFYDKTPEGKWGTKVAVQTDIEILGMRKGKKNEGCSV